MDAFSSGTAASRRPWSQTLSKKKTTSQLYRNEETVTLPTLVRRPSRRNNLLSTFVASHFEENDRESYSRSQLRAMASSKLLSSSNNNARTHSSTERLAPLAPAIFKKTRNQQRQTLPKPLEAAINEVLAVRNEDESVSDRGESRDDCSLYYDGSDTPAISKVKRASPCKTQIQSRRPEWSRYIRRIMMTKGIQGSTLARYRRLVGIVARKNLNQSFADAAGRVVQYRLEFKSAVIIQMMILNFLTRRRLAKQLLRHRAVAKVQRVWRKIVELEKQRKLAEAQRVENIERLQRFGAIRSIQRSYRKYRRICHLREEERRQQEQASLLQKARLKLLRRYQSWRENSKRVKNIRLELTDGGGISSITMRYERAEMEATCGSKETDVEVAAACVSIVREENVTADIVDVTLHRDKLNVTEQTPDVVLRKNDERLNDQEVTLPDDALNVPQQGESSEKREAVDTAAFIDKCLISNQDEDSSFRKCFLLDIVVDSESKTEPEDENESDENNQSVDEVPAEEPGFISCSDGRERSPPRHTDVTEGETTDTLAALAIIAATEIARTKAAKRISCFLLPKLQARQVQKTHAVVQIQCLARVYLAKLCVDRVRLALLHSLRAQLLASWQVTSSTDTDEKLNEVRGHDPHLDQNDDEDDELDQELQGYQPSTHEFLDEYIHVLPTWNGQIPPGVPLLRSSAGAPLLSLWKWSWPDEKWISNNQ